MKTRLTELLGIKHPVVQGAMAWVSFPQLVAAVSNAGGLGILGSAFMSADELRLSIQQVRDLTGKPFAINLLPDNPDLEEVLDVMVEQKAPVVSYGIGNPQKIIKRAKLAGIIAMPTTGAVKHAARAEQDGADAVIAQGTEAGGHSSHVATIVLVPLIVQRVKIPVVAAGGIGDARGLAAALAMGAEGISMGTRFIVTRESPVSENVKRMILDATEEDTVVTGHATGVRCRVLRNKFAESLLGMAEQKVSRDEMMLAGVGKMRRAFYEGDGEGGSVAAGQVTGLINDIPTCRDLIERIVEGAEQILGSLKDRVRA